MVKAAHGWGGDSDVLPGRPAKAASREGLGPGSAVRRGLPWVLNYPCVRGRLSKSVRTTAALEPHRPSHVVRGAPAPPIPRRPE